MNQAFRWICVVNHSVAGLWAFSSPLHLTAFEQSCNSLALPCQSRAERLTSLCAWPDGRESFSVGMSSCRSISSICAVFKLTHPVKMLNFDKLQLCCYLGGFIYLAGWPLFTNPPNKLRTTCPGDCWESFQHQKKKKDEIRKNSGKKKGSTSRDASLVFNVFFCLVGEVWTCVINVTDLQFNSCITIRN